MKKTLYFKFLLGYLIFGLFGFFIVGSYIAELTRRQVIREEAGMLYREASLLSRTYASELYRSKVSLEAVRRELLAMDAYLDAAIWIINPSGRLVLDSRNELNVEEPVIVEGFDSTISGGSYYTTGNFFSSFQEQMLTVLAPVTSSYKVQGYVVIHYPVEKLSARVNERLVISYVELAILFLLSLIILLFFTGMVYLPIRRITDAVEQYGEGNMHYNLEVESEDELGYLAASISFMAGRVARSEDNQKKFIANVSHDFRSPLTSIHGYLVAMLDGTIPEELYKKYLGIVLNETDRLTKLTNSLLTLNNLNISGVVLEKKVFDINVMLHKIAESFEGTCREKGIRISLELTGENFFVEADEGKIEQVLYNLMDNAVKFTGQGGEISIETSEKGSKLFISVKDTGIGIPKDDLQKVWDRFYKTDLSRGKDKKGTGLGLSIAKEIIQAHGEYITVVSTEGVGTEFSFPLPVADEGEEEW
ncbi:MAG: two-component sensor histidine kinase [Lachnospiraceae bacterium]|nr:two-component sensor histidine kinase [Lachnospiraceae bacterium]